MKMDRLGLAFVIVGVLVVGSVVVLGALSAYESQAKEPAAIVPAAQQTIMMQEEAVAIAQTVAAGAVTEVELKRKKSDLSYIYYEVEIKDGSKVADVKVHAVSGTVLGVTFEEDDTLTRSDLDQISTKISESEARRIAQSAVPGAVITLIEAEMDGNTPVYDVELSYNGKTAVIVIDIRTGEILEIDMDDRLEDDEDENEGQDVPITGSALEKASAAALKYIGEGRVTDTEVGDEEGYYEIEITLDNGGEVDVHLDENFNVLSTEYEDEDDDD